MSLPHTMVLRERLAAAEVRHQEAQRTSGTGENITRLRNVARHLNELLEEAAVRDAALLERPEDCWCFGLGGRGLCLPAKWPDGTSALGPYEAAGRSGGRPDHHPPTPIVLSMEPEDMIFAVTCPYCAEGAAEAERKRLVYQTGSTRLGEAQAVTMERMWQESGIPSECWGWSIDTHPLCAYDFTLTERLSAYYAGKAFDGSWGFLGRRGRGKTGAGIAACRLWHERQRVPFRFVSVPDLFASVRSTYGRGEGYTGPQEDDIIQELRRTGLLMLDDLGMQHTRSETWQRDILFRIIDYRSSHALPIIFTSNMTIEELSASLDKRLIDRLVKMCGPERMITINGVNLRTGEDDDD